VRAGLTDKTKKSRVQKKNRRRKIYGFLLAQASNERLPLEILGKAKISGAGTTAQSAASQKEEKSFQLNDKLIR